MSYVMLCVLGLMTGCGQEPPAAPLTTEQIKAYQAQEAVTIRTDGYQPHVLQKQCIDGVEYYAGRAGHALYVTPVVDKTTLQFRPCGLP